MLDTFVILIYNYIILLLVIKLKRVFLIALVIIFTFVSCLAINSYSRRFKSINNYQELNRINLVIDAGHGGIDVGTIGVDNSLEKGINLNIALALYDFSVISGISSFMTRDGDYLVYKQNDDRRRSDLYNRMNFINSIDNSVLVSIHQNHFENEKEWGMQVWYSPNDEKSPVLADNILDISKQFLQPDNTRVNKISDNSYYLLYKAECPSVMVECGFMSNTNENKLLQDNEYQKKLAYSILLGINKYITEEL